MSASSPTPPVAEEPVQTLRTIPLLVASLAGMGLASHLAADSLRMAALLVLGSLLGVTLYHSSFGFTAAYRRLILHGEVRGIRAQLVMLAAATLLFAPVLAAGKIFGQPVSGAVAPVGVSMFFGAFLFGIGMQLGGGCGSGTLYAVGGGSPRMLLVLTAFCGGGFWASLHMGAWQSLPEWEPQALGERFGWTVTALVQAGGLAMGYGARLSYGCNIGAFFSGVASTSLHGWVWIIAALVGSWLGVRWRPVFGLVNEPASRRTEAIEPGAALRLR